MPWSFETQNKHIPENVSSAIEVFEFELHRAVDNVANFLAMKFSVSHFPTHPCFA